MAEAIVLNITNKILGELTSLAVQEVVKIWGVDDELEKLKNTVETLQAVLLDAEEQYHQSHQIKTWLERLKDVIYDAQDVLEECNIQALRRGLRSGNGKIKQVCTFFSSSNQLAFKSKMSRKVRAIRERMDNIADDRKKFRLKERSMDPHVGRESRVIMREKIDSFLWEEEIIGRDEDKEKILQLLLDSSANESVSVLPIIGMGGLGKTALAKSIYNNAVVEKHFDLKMSVCVSDGFDVEKVVRDILESAKKDGQNNVRTDQLQKELEKEINGKKYLLILDDVWNEDPEKWRRFKSLLMGGARGSKILITTRLQLVVDIVGTTPPYPLGGLSDSMSLNLLMRLACKEEGISIAEKKEEGTSIAEKKEEESRDIEEKRSIGEETVKKCCGVPLAIRVIGSLLFFKKSAAEWRYFKDHELPEVYRKEDGVNLILKLSYDHLPSHLKPCFAFCSLFPKDYTIDKQKLMSLWMAEGFILQMNGSTQHLEDVADLYFMDLLSRNFFQDITKDYYLGQVETFKMHDLMHDLACLVAGTECARRCDSQSQVHERTRHVSYDPFVGFPNELVDHMIKGNKLRTLIVVKRNPWTLKYSGKIRISESACKELISSSRRLHVLEFFYSGIERLPSSIGKLRHLTYLWISGEPRIKKLPNSITRLLNLQTLVLEDCRWLKELPRDIRLLVSLRQLSIYKCESLRYMPCGLGQLTSLHGLALFILPGVEHNSKDCGRLSELNGLNNLRGNLRIEVEGEINDEEAESESANLIEKRSLASLELVFKNRDGYEILLEGLRPHDNLRHLEITNFGGRRLPRWLSCMPNLVDLFLFNCQKCRRLPPIDQLPRLKSLRIRGLREVECIESDNHHNHSTTTSFPLLSKLEILYCPKLKSIPPLPHVEDLQLWDVSPELLQLSLGLHKLKKLRIWYVSSLEGLHEEFLQDLTSLEHLRIENCSRLAHFLPGIRHLINLETLHIWCCDELNLSIDENGNTAEYLGLHKLSKVIIDGNSKLISIPSWLRHSTALQVLSISSFLNLSTLPEWIGDLQSLQELTISYCRSLTSLPEGMQCLSSLQKLKITCCPALEKRCQKHLGEDWYKIAHVPKITIEPRPNNDPFP